MGRPSMPGLHSHTLAPSTEHRAPHSNSDLQLSWKPESFSASVLILPALGGAFRDPYPNLPRSVTTGPRGWIPSILCYQALVGTAELSETKLQALQIWASEMAQQGKVLAAKPGYPSSIPRTQERTESVKLSSDFHACTVTICGLSQLLETQDLSFMCMCVSTSMCMWMHQLFIHSNIT